MRWCSSSSRGPDLAACLQAAAAELRAGLGPERPDLALVFVSSLFHHRFDELPALMEAHLPCRHWVGCSAGGVLGGGLELEATTAVSLVAAHLPEVELRPFHLLEPGRPDLDAPPEAWREWSGLSGLSLGGLLLLSHPIGFDVETALLGLDYAWPSAPKVGGVAAGPARPGGSALFLDGHVLGSGLVGVGLGGAISVEAVVAQGCRPVGPRLVVTRCEGGRILELAGRPALEALGELAGGLSSRDQRLMGHSLLLGVASPTGSLEPGPGDFLIRPLLGIDPGRRSLAVGWPARHGQVVQFHLREGRAAAVELASRLESQAARAGGAAPAGALLFTCLGRGQSLYGESGHDSRVFRSILGDVPLGGFFAQGEIGPVGGRTHLHGYTSSFALFRPRLV